MSSQQKNEDTALRLALYRFIANKGHVPTIRELAKTLSLGEKYLRAAVRRLANAHIIVLQEGSSEILRAAPFWAVPTPFHVRSGKHTWWGTCIWDALGIPAVLRRDAIITTACPCCDSPMALRVQGGRLSKTHGIVHFAVPAWRWYENLIFT